MEIQGPFPSYRYLVSLCSPFGADKALGGFQDAGGLHTSSPLKIHGTHKVNDVTLKRGVVGSSDLWNWLHQTRSGGGHPSEVVITLRTATGQPVQAWKLGSAKPSKYTVPALRGSSNDVAIEELVLSAESIEIVPPHRHHRKAAGTS